MPTAFTCSTCLPRSTLLLASSMRKPRPRACGLCAPGQNRTRWVSTEIRTREAHECAPCVDRYEFGDDDPETPALFRVDRTYANQHLELDPTTLQPREAYCSAEPPQACARLKTASASTPHSPMNPTRSSRTTMF